MNKQFLILAFILCFSVVGLRAQQKIFDGSLPNGTNMPNADAILELESKFKGLLFSRLELVATGNPAPLKNHVAGMMVYNTTSNTQIQPGIFYNDGVKWISVGGANASSNIHYDPTTYFISYLDESGKEVTINLPEIIKKNQTVTLLRNNGQGSYTYFNENAIDAAGNAIESLGVTIDVTNDVINNFEEIIKNQNVLNEITNIINQIAGGNVSYDGTNLTYVDSNGDTQIINIDELINETVTTLVHDGTASTYTYTNEEGTTTLIDVAADVINKFDEIINNTEVKEILNQFITNSEGNVSYDGTNLTYVDANGDTQIINLDELINETVTTLVHDGTASTYTYTNEEGTTTLIDVAADVINKFDEIINNTEVKEILNQFITNSEGNVSYDGTNLTYVDANGDTQIINIDELIKGHETVTTLVHDGTASTYTYTNEEGTTTLIDVAADVINKFDEIINNTEVKEILNQFITNSEGNVSYDGTNLTYVDANGDTQIINIDELINETVTTLVHDGTASTYTYTNEEGTTTLIDVAADVINKFDEIINNTEVKEILNQFITNSEGNVSYDGTNLTYVDANGDTQIINIDELIKGHETVTTLVHDGTASTYTYTNEEGTTTLIDVAADVINKFDEIINNTEVKEILNQFITNSEGNVSYDGTNLTYVDANGDTQIINLDELINETVTTLVHDGTASTYTYTNEEGTTTLIDVAADVINKFDEIINNTEVKEILNQFITNSEGNVSYDGTNLTYVDANGDTQIINIDELIKGHETVTTLVHDGTASTYTYTNEEGTTTLIDVAADVINKFDEIINNTEVKEILNQFITNSEGNVSYDGTNLTYVDSNGDTQIINLDELIKGHETVTTLVHDGTASTYTYTNEEGTTTLIDVAADVINKFDEIINNTEVKEILNQFITNSEGNVSYDGTNLTYVDANGDTQIINLDELINETVTTLVHDGTASTYTYTNEEGTTTLIDVAADVINKFDEIINNTEVKEILNQFITNSEGNVSYDGTNLTYVDANGDTQIINIDELINETVTTLVHDGTASTYTYTNEEGTTTLIDVAADVINKFDEIINNTEVKEILNQFITNSEGNVSYDGTNLTYVDANGDTQIINIDELINETVTTLVHDGTASTYTYTNEEGTTTLIDVAADVINKFDEIINNTEVKEILNQFITNSEGNVSYDGTNLTYVDANGDTQIINLDELINETVTTLVHDGTASTYTYTNEEGTTTLIDVAADVINKFDEIINNTEVKEILNQFITNSEGNVSYDGTNLTYVDGNGDTQIINIDELINETVTTLVHDGTASTYTYTNEEGTTTLIDVAADVINKFDEIINNTEVKEILNQFITNSEGNVSYDGTNLTYVDANGDTQIINIDELIKGHETVTTLVHDGTASTYTYTNEEGTTTLIDVAADVINKFDEIINNTEVKEILNQFITNSEGNVSYDGTNLTYVDANGDTQIINIDELINETVTTLVHDGTASTYTYTNEEGTTTLIDVAADVINKFDEIINNTEVKEILNQFITNSEGNVSYDGTNLTYVDANGDTQIINIDELINETVTTLVHDGTASTYTYTNEEGTTTLIDVAADVINKFDEIINNTEVKEILNQFITNSEGNVSYDGTNLTYVDANGDTQIINIDELINETVTTLVHDGTASTYTYTNEEGTTTLIDVAADVINKFDEIINNTEVKEILNQFITNSEGNVSYDGTNLTYVDANGDTQIINLDELINETVTTLVHDGTASTYTYTNEEGTTTLIDVAADVINKFDEIINNTEVKEILNQFITNSEGNVSYDGTNLTYVDANGDTQIINIDELIKGHETVTTLVHDGTASTYTYTNEEGTTTLIDVAADVINKFDEIINNTEVKEILNQFITNSEGNVSYDGTNLTYVDANGDTQIINIDELIKGHETVTTLVHDGTASTYTYTNEEGTTTLIDVAADVINKFDEIINNTEVKEILNQFITNSEGNVSYDGTNLTYVDANGDTQIINLDELINETVTTLVHDGTASTYTYTNEEGTTTLIDVAADVINKFDEIINNTEVKEILNQFITNSEGNVSYDGTNLTYVDANGDTQIINLDEIINEALIDYSAIIQSTGRKWLDKKDVKEITLDFTWSSPDVEFKLPDLMPDQVIIIGVRLINKVNNSISTNLVKYAPDTKVLTFGLAGSLVGVHPAGDYHLIVEFVEK